MAVARRGLVKLYDSKEGFNPEMEKPPDLNEMKETEAKKLAEKLANSFGGSCKLFGSIAGT